MPTYMCFAHRGRLSDGQRAEVAAGISRIHGEATGAPVSFVQCVFQEFGSGGHFIGGQPAAEGGIWVYGHIRGGRTAEVKNRLVTEIRDHLAQVAGVEESLIWVYLNELVHTDMVEFGRVLPEQGEEQDWVDSLPPDLRNQLIALG